MVEPKPLPFRSSELPFASGSPILVLASGKVPVRRRFRKVEGMFPAIGLDKETQLNCQHGRNGRD
jgi:hypothetical protein